MTKRRQTFLLLAILLLAAALRLTGLDWDNYEHYHPDERYVAWVATTIEWPASLASAPAPRETSLNPYYWPPDASSEGIEVLQDRPRTFAYGHLPLYLGVAATRLVEQVAPALRHLLPAGWPLRADLLNGAQANEFRHLTAVARALTALVDVGSVALIFFLGRRLYDPAVGLAAAAFLAANVMHVQLAHFFTVDPFLTFFTVAAVTIMASMAQPEIEGRALAGRVFLAGAAIGLAIGSKFSAVLLFLPLLVVFWLRRRGGQSAGGRHLLLAVAATVGAFALTNPFAVLDWTCEVITPPLDVGPVAVPALDWRSCFLDNITRQSAMIRGGNDFPFTRQYVGTVPYVYPILMQLRWGMGPLLGLAAFGGFAWALWRGIRWAMEQRAPAEVRQTIDVSRPEIAVLAWTLPYFLLTGSFSVKFMRYLAPLTPFLMLYAAAWILSLRRARLRPAALGLVFVTTVLYAFSFVAMHGTPHPWVSASRWIYDNVDAGALIVSETWDDPLPSSMDVDGRFYNRHVYNFQEVNLLSGSGPEDDRLKLESNLSRLAQADYLSLSSNRGYGVVPRLPDLYPLSSEYYRLLFSGALGYEVVYVTGRSPRLGSLHIWPRRFAGTQLAIPPPVEDYLAASPRFSWGTADESFTVYDQPLPIILQNTGRLTADEMLARFDEIE